MVELILLAQAVATGAGIALLSLGYRTYSASGKPTTTSFSLLMGILGITAVCAGATAHTGIAYKLVWLYTSLAIPLALAFFAFDYYGIDFFGTRLRVVGALTPALTGAIGGAIVILGTPAMSPGETAPVTVLAELPAFGVQMASTLNQIGLYYTTAVMILAVGLVVRTVSRYEHLDGRLGPAIIFVGVWPWLANLFVPQIASGFSFGVGVGAVAAGYTVSAGIAALAVGPLRLLDSSPMAGTVGPDIVLDAMDDVVLFVDTDERVLRLNEEARATFETTDARAVGGSIASIVGLTVDELDTSDPVPVETADGIRQFEVIRSVVTDRRGDAAGSVVVMRDVTRRQTREQRLDVFNRILRHNLRNDATAIIGRAQLVSDGGNPEECADQIIGTTRGLVDMAERAREIDRIMTVSDLDGTTHVRSVVDSVVEDVRGTYPAVELTTAVPDDVTAAVPGEIVRIVVRNLVENAAQHNDSDEPFALVAADTADDSLTVAISDNGPGIPKHERAVVEAGEENQLEHGSGIGLWAVYMGVTQMGGEISFSENEPRGSVVSVTLPLADENRSAERHPAGTTAE